MENLAGWLTTVVGRVCLNVLRSRATRSENSLDTHITESIETNDERTDPEQEALLADSIGLALLVVLDTLAPLERVAFVLHDMFAVPFEEIAPIVGRSTPATRQLASRARRRVQGQDAIRDSDRLRQAKLVDAVLAAARNGDVSALLALLDPDIVLRAGEQAIKLGAAEEIHGAPDVAAAFSRRARGVRPALVNGAAGAVWMPAGQLRGVVSFTTSGDKITAIDLIADPERLHPAEQPVRVCASSASSLGIIRSTHLRPRNLPTRCSRRRRHRGA